MTQNKSTSKLMILLLGLMFVITSKSAQASEDQLADSLAAIHGALDQGLSDQETEGRYQGLLNKYKTPSDKGRILAHRATMSSRAGIKDVLKVSNYCDQALQQPLRVLDSIRMNSCLSSAREIMYKNSKRTDFAQARREILIPALRALKISLDNLTQTERQPLPTVDRFSINCDTDIPKCRELTNQAQQKYFKQIAERQRVDYQNELIHWRDSLIDSCVSLSVRKPSSKEGLTEMATKELGKEHNNTTQDLIQRFNERIKGPKQPDKPHPIGGEKKAKNAQKVR